MSGGWTKDNYTIGEVSAIFDIPAKMLRYWDRIGVLNPHSVDDVNGYRYYSSSQFYLFSFIRYLRKLGVPYDNIKTQLNETNILSLEDLLREQVVEIEKRIKELSDIKKTFVNHIADIEDALNKSDLDKIEISHLPARETIMVEQPFDDREAFEAASSKLQDVLTGSPILLISQVATIMRREDFINGDYYKFRGVSIAAGRYKANKKFIVREPEGDYAIMRFCGNLSNSEKYYDRFLNYLKNNEYLICGDLVRKCLAPGTFEGGHNHLAEICIRVEKNNINSD